MSSKNEKIVKTDQQWKELLSPEEFNICRRQGTERAFTGKYWQCDKKTGMFNCKCCGSALFKTDDKYDSGSGWPSFTRSVAKENVREHQDLTHGMHRTEVLCAKCDAHLGHVFPDGPAPTGLRYCINSASLDFEAEQ